MEGLQQHEGEELRRVRVDMGTLDRHKQQFVEFLEAEDGPGAAGNYKEVITQTIGKQGRRVIVNLNDLREFDMELARRVLTNPLEYLLALETAVKEVAQRIDPAFGKVATRQEELKVGFDGAFGQNLVSPRGLSSRKLAQLVCVEGIVTKCSLVRPKVVRSVHYCQANGEHVVRDYRDSTSLSIGIEAGGRPLLPTQTTYPSRDKDGNPLETEYGLSTYKDYQSVTIQEMPERAPLGQMPRAVNLVLEYDLVDKVKPGDRVRVMGVYKALAAHNNGSTSGVFQTVVLANNVRLIGKDSGAQLKVSAEDIGHIRALAREENVLEVLGRSLAPSIYGHEFIKKALVLQAIGGVEKSLANGTHLRGDINVLLVGDPSTAKSQLLRAVLNTSLLAISTTGRGSSGVGLTAAVVTDADTGDRRLEAGAMVLADRGTVCIDEFDKMSEADRVAIHEVMEQQTVTIAKAGIHASLNARCSVLAAANPVYGQYDRRRPVQENVGLPDSLLSRFDLLFIVLDQIDPAVDRAIAEHVIRAHSYRRPGVDPMAPERLTAGPVEASSGGGADEDAPEEHRVWEKANPLAQDGGALALNQQQHGGAGHGPESDILTKAFLRKYIFYAKSRVQPKLTTEAEDAIANYYYTLRAKQERKTVPITPRTLETLIRLATAHAKVRLSPDVTRADCEAAMDLLAFALYHEGDERYNAHLQHVIPPTEEEEDGAGTDGDEDGGDDGGGGADGGAAGGRKRRKARGPEGEEEEDEFGDGEEDEEDGSTRGRGAHSPATTDEEAEAAAAAGASKRPRRGQAAQAQQQPGGKGGAAAAASSRSDLFVGRLSHALAAHADGVNLDGFLESLNTELQGEGQRAFSAEEALGIVQAADEAGKLFWEENARIIYQ